MTKTLSAFLIFFILCSLPAKGQQIQLTPMMGWASWNNYRININENIIKTQTDALVSSGMKKAGYNFINIDDGYFGGRDGNGNIKTHPTRFTTGVKKVIEYIHSKGLKAGIYSDAGINTCASYWDNDTIGVGMGLFGHETQDLQMFINDWGINFIKVDWCGGEWLDLDEEQRYTSIAKTIKDINPSVLLNVCRWQFPGKWVCSVGNSWRISRDIGNKFSNVLSIIDLNADLWKYASPGHFNDMDMLQVGRGMSYEEDKVHFSMWCMMCSPLLAGNDLTKMSKETLEILTNEEMIAINQDPYVYQARRLRDDGEQELWAKPLHSTVSGQVAVALLNRANEKTSIEINMDSIGIDASKGYILRDVWTKTTSPKSNNKTQKFELQPHSVIVLKINGVSKPYNVFQTK